MADKVEIDAAKAEAVVLSTWDHAKAIYIAYRDYALLTLVVLGAYAHVYKPLAALFKYAK